MQPRVMRGCRSFEWARAFVQINFGAEEFTSRARSPATPTMARAAWTPPQGRGRAGMEKVPMTAKGFAALDAELKNLKYKERHAVIAAISEAREHGDLSENAEYHSAKERQSYIEGRIQEIEGLISRADIIDPSKMTGAIKFGATVKLVDEDTDEEKNFQIVGEAESDIAKGLLNLRSPLARALIGKQPGDSVEVMTPGGGKSYEVLDVRYI
ncbi:MAG: transcription elongation factor GreA [Paracoccaceae bacterium]